METILGLSGWDLIALVAVFGIGYSVFRKYSRQVKKVVEGNVTLPA
mgnify:CR=1 FL=1|tara:strand:+ start:512 stop:649 length:138 start_codon:yes stop_codon:yes gene_type:complete